MMRNLLVQSLYRSFQITVNNFLCFQPIGIFTAKLNCPGRTYSSWKQIDFPETLTDVEEYVARDFSYPHLKNKLNKDSQLPVVTKQTTLSTIGTIDGVLNEIANSHTSGTLWPEELNLYFAALIRKTSSLQTSVWSHDKRDENDDKPIVERLHDDPYFQILVKQALRASSTLPTYYLSQFFSAFIKLHIPPLSNTVLLLTARIQDRVNEFFPDEVLTCLQTIYTLEKSGISCLRPFHDGLIMHLENQLLDPPTFNRILKSIPITRRLKLLRYSLSTELAALILNSVKETAQTKRERSLRNRKDAEILLSLLWKQQYPKKYLWSIAMMYFDENPHELTELSRQTLNDIRKRIDVA